MENKNNTNYFRPLLVLAIVLLALFVGIRLGKMNGTSKAFSFIVPKQNKMTTILDLVSKYYVDTISIDDIVEPLIPEVLKELDPHSVYISAAEFQRSNESLEGNFEGIGVTFNMPNDTVIVINVVEDGPSAKAGVHPGDRIINVNDMLIAGQDIDSDSIKTLLRGRSGSIVEIKVKRQGNAELLPLEITRGNIPLKSIDVAYMITPSTGYIRMTRFAKNTYSEFIQTVNALHKDGMTSMVVDLRNNAGGFLDQVNAITSEMFKERKLIVYTEGRAFPRENTYSEGKGKCGNDTLIVLINENSASASEILAGAIQDNDRGLIVGHRSFGKGLVQRLIDLPDNSGLRLTIARYYTPSGRSIQRPYGHGSEGMIEYYNDLSRRYQDGELTNADSIKQTDSTKYYTSKGRIVYGGGGVTPDVFVPYEMADDFTIKVRRRELPYNYSLAFADRHRAKLNEIKDLAQLDQFFKENDPFPGFIEYAKKAGIEMTNKDIEDSKETLDIYIKQYISQYTFLDQLGVVYFQNQMDKTVLKALELINTGMDI